MKKKLEQLAKRQESLITEAGNALDEANAHMKNALCDWETDSDELQTLQGLKLMLQYRLDSQSALAQLGQLQNYLLQILGVEHGHSYERNLERLGFALGIDDLQQLLHLLNHLIDSILRILAQNQKQQLLERKKHLELLRSRQKMPELSLAIDKLQTFSHKMRELRLVLEETPGAPHPGVVYDHIAALEGPISRFQQALQHGLGLSSGLYHRIGQTTQHAKELIHQIKQSLEPHRLFTPTQQHSAERLEERAATKRFGIYFNK